VVVVTIREEVDLCCEPSRFELRTTTTITTTTTTTTLMLSF